MLWVRGAISCEFKFIFPSECYKNVFSNKVEKYSGYQIPLLDILMLSIKLVWLVGSQIALVEMAYTR